MDLHRTDARNAKSEFKPNPGSQEAVSLSRSCLLEQKFKKAEN